MSHFFVSFYFFLSPNNLQTYDSLNSIFFLPKNNTKNLNFIHLNIRSVRRNFDSLLLELAQFKYQLHFIVLSEVWIGSDEIQFYNIEGYKKFYHCNDNYRSGGVICFVSNEVQVNQISNNAFTTADTLLLTIEYNKIYFNLFCLYRLQEFSTKNFIDELEVFLSQISNNTIYVGDANLNLFDQSQCIQKYHNLLNNNGFLSLINSPTRITNSSRTCIDHIFVKHKNINVFESAIFDLGITDHCALGLVYRINNSLDIKNSSKLVEVKSIDYDLLVNKLSNFDFHELFALTDVNICFDKFHSILSTLVSKCTKTGSRNRLDKARLKSPWINKNLLKKFQTRKKIFKITKRRPYDLVLRKYYSDFCFKLNAEITFSKNLYISNKIKNCNGDAKQQWQIINNLSGETKCKNIDRIESLEGIIIEDPKEIVECINSYLISVQSAGDNNHTMANAIHSPSRNIADSFFVAPTTPVEIVNIINSLKNKTSSGFDGFNTVLIKRIANYIAPVLSFIINLSFKEGVFPEKLKSSVVIPILKKPNIFKIDNIRPISLLSIFSKIFEKTMKCRLVKYLEIHNFLSPYQFGFIKKKSTEDALITVSDKIYSNLNQKNKITGLFIDFRKAFDLVDHSILMNKLETIGIRGVALSWFTSYLTGRTQRVRVGDSLSDPLLIRSGVPQGAVLSANLFLIFINDLLTQPLFGTINAFADDLAIFYFKNNVQEIWDCIVSDLKLIRSWCLFNKMQINVDKTKYINFDHKSFEFTNILKFHEINCNEQVICSCKSIEKVDCFKYLGVTLDENLSWDKHINSLHNKLKYSIRKFYHLRNFCEVSLLRTLYYALVQSRLEYGLGCWGGAYSYLINRLRTTQNHFIRIILSKNIRDSSFPLFKQLKILPIEHLFVFKVLKLFFLRSGNIAPNEFSYLTRSINRKKIKLPKVQKTIFRKSNQYLGPKYFNLLPYEIKNCNSFKTFSVKVKNWIFLQENICSLNIILN